MAVETEATVRRVNYVRPEELTDYLCTLCGKIVHNPRKTHCDQRVCSPCIESDFQTECETRINCPVCTNGEAVGLDDAAQSGDYKLSDFEFDEAARRHLDEQDCYCYNQAAGCKNEPLLANNLQEHLKTCLFEEVNCQNGLCEFKYRRGDVVRINCHLECQCQFAFIECVDCRYDILGKEQDIHSDGHNCTMSAEKRCSCGKRFTRRSELLRHTRTVPSCITRAGRCWYSRYGCDFNAETVKALSDHIETSKQSHINMAAPQYKEVLEEHSKSCDDEWPPKQRVDKMKKQAKEALRMLVDTRLGGNTKSKFADCLHACLLHLEKMPEELSEIDWTELLCRDIDIRVNAIKGLLHNDKVLTVLENGGIPSFNSKLIWTIPDYNAQLERARNGNLLSFYSPPFYTSFIGYKMRARVYLYGVDPHKGKKMAIFLTISKGAYDHTLKWPFPRKITFAIVKPGDETEKNQKTIQPDGGAPFCEPTSELNPTTGCADFMDVNLVEEEYISQNGVLTLSVSVETSPDDDNWWKE